MFLSFSFCPTDNGPVHQVFKAGLEVRIEIGPTKNGQIQVPMNIEWVFEYNLILGQGSCLIRTENIDSAQVLDGIKLFDNHFFFGHDNGTLSQASCDNHWKHFRSQTHSYTEGKDACF